MKYTENNIQKLYSKYQEARSGYYDILPKAFQIHLTKDKAKEYFLHGFMRRYGLLLHCLDQIFDIYPPDRISILSTKENLDITIFLQSFFINLYGAIDNLAWVVNCEKELQLNKNSINLYNKEICKNFTNEFNAYLNNNEENNFKNWYNNYCKNFRHATGHRIPPYIPPYAIDPSSNEKHILPLFVHSYGEKSPNMQLHAQLICDFLLITELVNKFIQGFK